jgi:hypothetical protein
MVDLYALQIFLFELLLYEIKIMCRVCTEIEEKNNYGLKSRDPCWSCVQKTGPLSRDSPYSESKGPEVGAIAGVALCSCKLGLILLL